MFEFRHLKVLSAAMLVVVPLAIGCAKKEKETPPPTPGAPQMGPAPAAAGATGTASISGKITFAGTAPKAATLKMEADAECVKAHKAPVKDEKVVLNANGTLKNVIVYIKSGISGSYSAPTSPAKLDQSGCIYTPRVLAVQAGQPLQVVNSDPTMHNVHALPAVNDPFNQAQPKGTPAIERSFAAAEPTPVKFKCDVHPWMTAHVGVFPHPFFAVTGDDGSFTIQNLPAGTYTLAAWHEAYPEQTLQVTVADGQAQAADFTFK